MSTEADHIALANKNHAVLSHLLKDFETFPEWVTVAAFYKAVQVVEAVFVKNQGRCCHGHQKRLESLKRCGYRDLHKHYRALWGASSVARYLYDTTQDKPYSCFTDYLTADQVKKNIAEKRLHGVECCAVGLLSENCKKSLLRVRP
ncbi:MAG TPA: hypothetical protein VMY42_06970 [Thermoguttaceae bacterium]|nr:hypothetical protein [Thermoguttaceae bacterium]